MNTPVTVTDIVEFARENHWMGTDRYGDPIIEKFVAIVMVTDTGAVLKNFTKFNRAFAQSVKVGDTFTLSYRVKEAREHASDVQLWGINVTRDDSYTAVTYCNKGLTKADALRAKKADKKAARLAKLGLTG